MFKMFQGHFLHLPASRNMPFLVSFSVLLHPKSLMLALDFSFVFKSQKNVNHLSTYWLILLPKHFRCLFSSVQSLSRVRLFATPWITAHQASLSIPEFTQTHVHRVGDAIQPSHPLSSPSPPAPNPSQHQGLFQWVNSSHEVAKVLEFQLQHQSFQWTPRTDVL